MSTRRRARRMARNHRRLNKPTRLNLVALMDIFTILVLFLIVNNGDVEVLQADKTVALPESVSEERPKATLVIKVTDEHILLEDRPVANVADSLEDNGEPLPQLAAALNSAAAFNDKASPNKTATEPEDAPNGRPIVIMGDKDTPYALLKRVMATCAETDYRDIALAVNSVPVKPASAGSIAMVEARP